MTTTSDLIRDRMSFSLTDWRISGADHATVVSAIDTDTAVESTIRDLGDDGRLLMFSRLNSASLPQVIQMVAARAAGQRANARAALARAARPAITGRGSVPHPAAKAIHYFSTVDYFDICADLADAARRLNFASGSTCTAPGTSYTGTSASSAFSGSGATGVNATDLSAITGAMSVVGGGKNPISNNLTGYLNGLTSSQKLGQARQVVCQPISTLFPKVYATGVPGRASVMGKAGSAHQLEGRLIAAAVLTEARDQSRREDAGEYRAAVTLGRNTSIGLGQVVVSTARSNLLFSDLLTPSLERRLSDSQIASLLASDEFNIFATAKYIRLVANMAAGSPATSKQVFRRWLPSLNYGLFSQHSRTWSIENVQALGSEYTSSPWDRGIVAGWGLLWGHAYQTYGSSGISF